MSMSKKILSILIILFCLILFTSNANAATTTTVIPCSSFSDSKSCSTMAKCRWISGSCQEMYVASEACNDNNIRTVLKLAGYVLLIARFVVPLLIIGYGTIDLYKSVIDKDEKSLQKQGKMIATRLIAGLVVFFIPTLVEVAFSMTDRLDVFDDENYLTCAACVLDPLDPDKCVTKDVFK